MIKVSRFGFLEVKCRFGDFRFQICDSVNNLCVGKILGLNCGQIFRGLCRKNIRVFIGRSFILFFFLHIYSYGDGFFRGYRFSIPTVSRAVTINLMAVFM